MTDPITTPEALDALPATSVVRSSAGTIATRLYSGDGVCFGVAASFPWDRLALPATVLFRPDAPTPTPAGDDQREALDGLAHLYALATNGCSCCSNADAETTAARDAVAAALAARPSATTVTTEQIEAEALARVPRRGMERHDVATRQAFTDGARWALGIEVTRSDEDRCFGCGETDCAGQCAH